MTEELNTCELCGTEILHTYKVWYRYHNAVGVGTTLKLYSCERCEFVIHRLYSKGEMKIGYE